MGKMGRPSTASLRGLVAPRRRLKHARAQRMYQRSGLRFNHSSSALVAPHFFDRVLVHSDRPALLTSSSSAPWTYAQLLHRAVELSDDVKQAMPASARHGKGSHSPRVAYLGSRGASYVTMQWATWLSGSVAVPLHPAHPVEELQYIMDDSDASVLVVSEEFVSEAGCLREFIDSVVNNGSTAVVVHKQPHATPSAQNNSHEDVVQAWLSSCSFDRTGAHIVYTSGTTGRPKGVVTTHAGLTAQIHDVVSAWEMTHHDHLLHFLPLHHVHGILNNLLCVHYAGGSLEFLPSAKPELIWSKLAEQQQQSHRRTVSMLMAVPTVYMNLLEEIERRRQSSLGTFDVDAAVDGAKRLRVAISGSMACPVSILNRWEDLTGLRLLERYGMTELGMALTNPLRGDRHLGYVGQPFPSVSVRLVDPETDEEIAIESEQEGELRVRGPSVFQEYWRKPEATAKEFDVDGWFKTGDIAQYSDANKSFRIRGRASADILKSGGFKISALDVERVLLAHPQIQECAVFGIPDEKWGQVVAAVLRTPHGVVDHVELAPNLIDFLKEQLADYAVPRKFFVVDEIPKNAMGKVNKKSLATLFK